MNAPDLLDAVRAAGVTLRADAGRILASPPGALPPDLTAALRDQKAQVLALLTHPACTSCGTPVPTPDSILCQACFDLRMARRLLPFDPDRRARTEARLAGTSCPACGWSWWQVSPRGDAWCLACRELAAGRTPRCGTCQRTDGWTTTDGRKRCTHAPVAVVPSRPGDGEACPDCGSTTWTPTLPKAGAVLFLCHGGHWWVASRPSQDAPPGASTAPSQETEPGGSFASRAAALFAPREARP